MGLHQNPLSVIIRSLHVLHLSTLCDFNICTLSSLIEEEAHECFAHECEAFSCSQDCLAWVGETQPTFCDGS